MKSRSRKAASTGSAFLTMGTAEVMAQSATLVQGIVIARAIGKEQLGIAMSILLLSEFLNRFLALNPGITLIQDPNGGSRTFRHTLQLLMGMRGACFALIMLALAWPLAWLYGLELHLLGFFAAACLPLIMGLTHIDISRQLRKRQYISAAMVNVIGHVASLGAAVLLSVWMHSYWLQLVARAVRLLSSTISSHALARRRFGLMLDRQHMRRIFLFSIPLAVAGILMFFTMQGPKFLIASSEQLFHTNHFDIADVAIFGIAMLLALQPVSIGERIVSQTWAPRLARVQDEPRRFLKIFAQAQTVSWTLGCSALILLTAGDAWIGLLYGDGYAGAGQVLGVLAIMAALRMGRGTARQAALSTGRSKIILVANIAGSLSIVAMVIAVPLGATLVTLAWCVVAGEVGALIVNNIALARCSLRLPASQLWLRPALLLGCALGISMIVHSLPVDTSRWLSAMAATLLALVFVCAAFLSDSAMRNHVLARIRREPHNDDLDG